MSSDTSKQGTPKFCIFRHDDADPAAGIPIMQSMPVKPETQQWAAKAVEAGVKQGHENRLLFSGAGFSLVYAWFKSGYPLPRHTHNSDCLYYVVAGSLRLGDQELGKGDGFFVGGDVPYSYVAGPEGVEILEFRAVEDFDINMLANNSRFWERVVKVVEERSEDWVEEQRPSESGVK